MTVVVAENKASISCVKCGHPVTMVQVGSAVVVKSALHKWVNTHIFHFHQPPLTSSVK